MKMDLVRLYTSNVECVFPDVQEKIPPHVLEDALRLQDYGLGDAAQFLEQRMHGGSFADAEAFFKEESRGSFVAHHLLLSIYFARVLNYFPPNVRSTLEGRLLSREDMNVIRNRSWVGTLIIHHLVLAMSRLNAESVESLFGWHHQLNLYRKNWTNRCAGALATLRVITAFSNRDLLVFLPKPEEDIFSKIDLFVISQREKLQICLQVKSVLSERPIFFIRLNPKDTRRFSDYQRRFFDGVSSYGDNWLPVECDISRLAFKPGHSVALDPLEIQSIVDTFIHSLSGKK